MMDKIKDFLKFLIGLRPPKIIYKMLISMVVLAIVLIGAGAGYAYYVGQTTEVEEQTPEPEETTNIREPIKKPQAPPADAPVSVSVQALTTPVAPGENATISIRSLVGATCEITVEYDGVESDDSGLGQKPTDDYGIVGWTWTVEPSRPEGEWPITVSCVRNDQSGVVATTLEVKTEED